MPNFKEEIIQILVRGDADAVRNEALSFRQFLHLSTYSNQVGTAAIVRGRPELKSSRSASRLSGRPRIAAAAARRPSTVELQVRQAAGVQLQSGAAPSSSVQRDWVRCYRVCQETKSGAAGRSGSRTSGSGSCSGHFSVSNTVSGDSLRQDNIHEVVHEVTGMIWRTMQRRPHFWRRPPPATSRL